MVTKEDVEKAEADYDAAEAGAWDAAEAGAAAARKALYADADAAYDKYTKLKRQYEMVTKEEVDKAKAIWVKADYAASWSAFVAKAAKATDAVVDAAYTKYQKLKEEYENERT